MRIRPIASLLCLVSFVALVAAMPPNSDFALASPIRFVASIAEDCELAEAYRAIQNIHMWHVERARITPYVPTSLLDSVVLNAQTTGDYHFSRGRAQLYQLPVPSRPDGQVWLSLARTPAQWIHTGGSQQLPPYVALVWHTDNGRMILSGSLGLTATYANTVRTTLPVYRPVAHPVAGVLGFSKYRDYRTPGGSSNFPPQS